MGNDRHCQKFKVHKVIMAAETVHVLFFGTELSGRDRFYVKLRISFTLSDIQNLAYRHTVSGSLIMVGHVGLLTIDFCRATGRRSLAKKKESTKAHEKAGTRSRKRLEQVQHTVMSVIVNVTRNDLTSGVNQTTTE